MTVLRTVDLRGQAITRSLVEETLPRAVIDIQNAQEQIRPLLERVRTEGLSAIQQASLEFDGFYPDPIWVSEVELENSLANLDSGLRASIEIAIERNHLVSSKTLPLGKSIEVSPGALVTERYVPVESVGVYVPGGKAVYPSSVVMGVVPAKVAGVSEIIIATPGQKEFGGRPHPTVLATARLLGVTKVLVIGGPSAIAAFAFGVPEINLNPVSLVIGPGNIFVAAAKRLVRGLVSIDSEAGTTEIMILGDQSSNPVLVAADLISQAEHDEAAAAILVSDSQRLISSVQQQIEKQLAVTENEARARAALSGIQSALVLVDSEKAAIDVANHYASEHLSIQTLNSRELAGKISNAGAVFIGDYTPVSLGDYLAGSNHVLPTGGAARIASGLSVHTFLRAQQVVEYSASALSELQKSVTVFAEAEGLPAHAAAVSRRFEGF